MSGSGAGSAHDDLLERFAAGRRSALARAISIVENERAGFEDLLHALHPAVGRAHRIGITGPPGAGKSTLTAELIARYRERGETVAVVAVDPTSPFTGGALLGDRIRMNEVAQDEGVFVRSMATRGAHGGLAVTTKEVVDVVDAYGFDRIIVETVGVGQSELDIAAAADSTVVVLVPESGDSIQTMKAGLMEAADLFVVNKADRPGAHRLVHEVELMLHLRVGQALRNVPAHHGVSASGAAGRQGRAGADAARAARGGAPGDEDGASGSEAFGSVGPPGPAGPEVGEWEVPVLETTAETGAGVDGLVEAVDRHRSWLAASGGLAERQRARLRERVRDVVRQRLLQAAWVEADGEARLEAALPALESGQATPYEVAGAIARAARGADS